MLPDPRTLTPVLALALALTACPGDPPAPEPETPAFPAWQFPEPTPLPDHAPTPTVVEGPDGRRCVEGDRRHLVVERDGVRSRDEPAEAALAGPDAVPVAAGRHAGESAIPVASLLPTGAAGVDLIPCRGQPLSLSAEALRESPGRYLLVLGGKGILKLIDTTADDRPLLRNLALVRVR